MGKSIKHALPFLPAQSLIETKASELRYLRDSKLIDGLLHWPIARLVWLFVLLILAVGWLFLLGQVDAERDEVEAAAITLSQDRATLLEQHVVMTLQVASLTSLRLSTLYLSPGTHQPLREAATPVSIPDSSREIAGYSAAAVFDAGGNIIASSGPDAEIPDVGHLARAFRSNADPNLVVQDYQKPGNRDDHVVIVTRRFAASGTTVGYVVLAFAPEQFLNFPLRTVFHPTDLVSVIGLDGITLARREGDTFSSGEDVNQGLVMDKQRADPNGTYIGPSALDGHVRYFSHRRLNEYPIFVTAGVSQSITLADTRRRATVYYAIMAALSILGILMAWLVQRELSYRARKATELAMSSSRLQNAQRVGRIGDWDYEISSGLLRLSKQLCLMYERAPEQNELSLEEFESYFMPEDFSRFQRDFERLLSVGGSYSYEMRVLLPSGTVSHRGIQAVAMVDDNGQLTRVYGTDQDITELHFLRELEKELAHLDRQGAMSMMAGTLAHELNQPLTAASNYVTGALRAAQRGGDDPNGHVMSGLNEALDQIHDAAEIIRRVRMMVKAEKEMVREADVGKVLADSLALLRASGVANVDVINTEVDRKLPQALIAPIQLQQVLINLLKNALEAAPSDASDVSVKIKSDDGQAIRIAIEDNGPGFSISTLEAFSAFGTNKKSGMGLGLSISRTIIEYHKGKLRIESSQAGKTVVTISLPAAPVAGA